MKAFFFTVITLITSFGFAQQTQPKNTQQDSIPMKPGPKSCFQTISRRFQSQSKYFCLRF